MKLYLHIIILVLFICMPSFGQPPHIITRYNIEDGLQQTITSITKDRKGYMWVTLHGMEYAALTDIRS